MSAFIVNPYHIDRMVATAVYGPSDANGLLARPWRWFEWECGRWHPSDLGQLLHNENVASVNYRYDESTTPDSYEFDATVKPMTGIEALKAISCYEYQSCEHPGWADSRAKELCERLTSAIIGCLPGYDTAPWEQQEPEPATTNA